MFLFDWIRSIPNKINLKDGWLPFLNENLKWAVAFFIRFSAIAATIGIMLYMVKVSGIVKHLRQVVTEDALGISQESTELKSAPDIDYDGDLTDSDDIINMLLLKKK